MIVFEKERRCAVVDGRANAFTRLAHSQIGQAPMMTGGGVSFSLDRSQIDFGIDSVDSVDGGRLSASMAV
jgi:hypothetical protein